MERILCGRRHVDHCQPAPTDTHLESGRGGQDTIQPPIHNDGADLGDCVHRTGPQQHPRSKPFPSTANSKMAIEGKEQRPTPTWDGIMETLKRFKVSPYLVRLIRYSYLNDRWIAYTGRNREEKRPVEYGVPQGSVLGPILWITAYDSVLRCPMPPGTDMVCLVGIRHLSPGRGSRMVRDIEARGDRRGMRNARRPETGPERVADQVRGIGVFRPSH
jgi:hypothetical protein